MKFLAAFIDSMSTEITRYLWWTKYYNIEENAKHQDRYAVSVMENDTVCRTLAVRLERVVKRGHLDVHVIWPHCQTTRVLLYSYHLFSTIFIIQQQKCFHIYNIHKIS